MHAVQKAVVDYAVWGVVVKDGQRLLEKDEESL